MIQEDAITNQHFPRTTKSTKAKTLAKSMKTTESTNAKSTKATNVAKSTKLTKTTCKTNHAGSTKS